MIRIDLQIESRADEIPVQAQLENWVQTALQHDYGELEQTLRIVDEPESRELNKAFRGIDKPTNVLSFPADPSEYLDYQHLGDLVICAPVVAREAEEQGKSLEAHWAHMVVHGMLHLQGYDHIEPSDAENMEQLEIEILVTLGHTNPYSIQQR